MIELLVSHYREPREVVDGLLRCIDSQRDVDFSEVLVTVCNDGIDVPLDLSAAHPYEVRYMEAERGGVSHTRNALLDAATGDHVMFIDCDDRLLGDRSLSRLVELSGLADMVIPSYMQERADGTLVRRDNRIQMMQGKVFRLSFLRERGIRFDDDFVIAGDPYFLWQAALLGSRAVVREPLYVWTYNVGSVCRDEPLHFHKAMWRRVESDGRLCALFDSLGMHGWADIFVRRLVTQPYVVRSTDGWTHCADTFDGMLARRTLAWWLARYLDRYLVMPEPVRRAAYDGFVRSYQSEPSGGFAGMVAWARGAADFEWGVC